MAEANFAAWAYTKYAMLFFIALIITWVRVTATFLPPSFGLRLQHF